MVDRVRSAVDVCVCGCAVGPDDHHAKDKFNVQSGDKFLDLL